MDLENFKRIADEQTADVVMTPELSARILSRCTGPRLVGKPVRAANPRRRALLVAMVACLAVIALSAGMLAVHSGKPIASPTSLPAADEVALVSSEANVVKVASTPLDAETLQAQLSAKGIELTGEFRDGYAPARNAEGLYGYVDQWGKWKIEPAYLSASELADGVATVIDQSGETLELNLSY